MSYVETIEKRFHDNILNCLDIIKDYLMDASEGGIIDMKPTYIRSIFSTGSKLIKSKSVDEWIENFITFSKSEEDKQEKSEAYSMRKYPEYWNLLSKLPKSEDVDRQDVPIAIELEEFLLEGMYTIFPLPEQVKPLIHTIYNYVYEDGTPFLTNEDKKHLGSFFRSFPILVIKYINIKRNPVIEDGKLVINKDKDTIQYQRGPNGYSKYHPEISIKNAMRLFEMTNQDMLK